MEIYAAQHNPELSQEWVGKLASYTADQLQMREQATENAIGLLSALHLTNPES